MPLGALKQEAWCTTVVAKAMHVYMKGGHATCQEEEKKRYLLKVFTNSIQYILLNNCSYSLSCCIGLENMIIFISLIFHDFWLT